MKPRCRRIVTHSHRRRRNRKGKVSILMWTTLTVVTKIQYLNVCHQFNQWTPSACLYLTVTAADYHESPSRQHSINIIDGFISAMQTHKSNKIRTFTGKHNPHNTHTHHCQPVTEKVNFPSLVLIDSQLQYFSDLHFIGIILLQC